MTLNEKISQQVDLNCDLIALLEVLEKSVLEGDNYQIFSVLKQIQQNARKANELWKEEMNDESEDSQSLVTVASRRGACDPGRSREANDVRGGKDEGQCSFF